MYFTKSTTVSQRGQSLIEILFAISLALIAIGTIAYLMFNTQVAARYAVESTRAEALAKEGIAATRSIAQHSFDDISEGSFGLQMEDGVWKFSGTPDTVGKYTRTISLTAVDNEIYSATSVVTWKVGGSRYSTTSLTTYVSNWEQTAGDAAGLFFDLDSITYTATGTSIQGITVQNNFDSKNVTITRLRFDWDGSPALVAIDIDGESVYASTSPQVLSGEEIDITDTLIGSTGIPVSFGPLFFTDDMQNTDLLIIAYLNDGSQKYARVHN